MPVKLDMSTAQPIQQHAAVKLDMSTAQRIGVAPDPNNPAATVPNPAAADNPNNPIVRDPTYHDYETIGSSEGAGLAEGLADWDRASIGEMGGGAADVARGDIAKGAHRVISGGMSATVPALPFAAAAAPLAVARGMIAGKMAGGAAHMGAEALGATPDQADLAGDVGNIAGAGVGVKAGGGRVGAVAKVGAQDALSHVPLVGRLVRRPSAMDYVTAAMKEPPKPAEPVYPGGSLPEMPAPEQLNPSLASPSRTLPGMHSKEVIQPPTEAPPAPAQPIPPRSGLQLRGAIAENMKTPETTPAAQQSAAPPPAPKASPRPVARGTLNKMMDQELGKALGAKQLDPKVPLRGQMAARMPAESDAALPEGHKAVDSSALRSYNYDAPAKEFHARATSGSTIYVYGDVSPESAAGFESAPSKGKAWQSIRQNHPLVAKIVDGKRIAVKPGVTSSP